jgi:hypothetical protein
VKVQMATTYLSPQRLKDFAQGVEEVAKKFPDEVVRIRHSFSCDWDGDPAINFRIVLTDKIRRDRRLSELSDLIGGALIKDLAPTSRSIPNTSHIFITGASRRKIS